MDDPIPSEPAIDETFTIEPNEAFKWGTQARTIWSTPTVLTTRILWNACASTASHADASPKTEVRGLFTSASMRFQRLMAAAAMALQSSSCETSPRSNKESAPAASQAACDCLASASLFEKL